MIVFENEEYLALERICKRRKSVRAFNEKEVYEDDLEKIINIANTSPFASGKKNWDLTIIKDKAKLSLISERIKSYLEEFTSLIKEDFRKDFINYSRNFTFFETAPAVIFLTYRTTSATSRSLDLNKAIDRDLLKVEEWERENSAKSISCVAMLILLAVESLGMGACYMTGGLLAESKFIDLITNKKERKIGAIIPIGYY